MSDQDSDASDYEEDEEQQHEGASEDGDSTEDGPQQDLVDDLTYDTFNLVACNYHTIRLNEHINKEKQLLELTQRAAGLLLKKIFECEIEKTDQGPLAILPEEAFRLPREKRIPEPKPETRWDKFAKEKGIENKKRDRMVWDDNFQEWRPRYGYKRAHNGVDEIPIVEVKNGQDPYADPWAVSRENKKERVARNLTNQVKNNWRASGRKGSLKEFSTATVPGIPIEVVKNGKRGKEGVKQALQLAQHSTQSMGRFDEQRDGEPARKLKGRKRSFRDNVTAMSSDRDTMKAQLRIVADKVEKKRKGVTNSLAAYEGIIPDAPSDSFKQKKGRSKSPSSSSGKSKGIGKGKGKGGKGKGKA